MTDYSEMSFAHLVDECIERGIKYTAKDTEETLRKKLARKSAKPTEPVETSEPREE